jgi:putative tricarboxylic transport membrane protein
METTMTNGRRYTHARGWILVLAASFACSLAAAADWKPDKRVEIVVPNAPGGGNDRVGRIIQKIIQENRLVDVVINVVNKPGGGGVIGFTYLNQHPGDGHYMAIASVTLLTDHISGRTALSYTDVVPIA